METEEGEIKTADRGATRSAEATRAEARWGGPSRVVRRAKARLCSPHCQGDLECTEHH